MGIRHLGKSGLVPLAAQRPPFGIEIAGLRRGGEAQLGQPAQALHLLLVFDEADELAQRGPGGVRSEEHTSELQSLMRSSYAVFCLKKKKHHSVTTMKIR